MSRASSASSAPAVDQNCVRRPPPIVVPLDILVARSDSTAA
jgi:hypothetical protein